MSSDCKRCVDCECFDFEDTMKLCQDVFNRLPWLEHVVNGPYTAAVSLNVSKISYVKALRCGGSP